MMIALGGVIAVFDKRYRKTRVNVQQPVIAKESDSSPALALAKKEA